MSGTRTVHGSVGRLGLALAATLLAAGCGATTSGAAPASTPAPVPASTTSSSAPAEPLPTGPAPLPKASKVSVTSVSIGSIDLKTSKLEKLRTDDDGVLEAPKDPDRAGWYSAGTVPGETGPAVIAGHVDSKTGPAVFFDLREVKKGDVIEVGLSDGTRKSFVADRVITTPKDGFPTDEVFGPTPDAELRLITCGGPYDRTVGSYVDNTVVFATARG